MSIFRWLTDEKAAVLRRQLKVVTDSNRQLITRLYARDVILCKQIRQMQKALEKTRKSRLALRLALEDQGKEMAAREAAYQRTSDGITDTDRMDFLEIEDSQWRRYFTLWTIADGQGNPYKTKRDAIDALIIRKRESETK